VRLYWPVTLAAALLVGLLAYGVAATGEDTSLDAAVARGARVDAPVADLPWLHKAGEGSLADYEGQVVVLNIWASWCEPCKEEMPLLQRTHERISKQGATVLGIDTSDATDRALAFLREHDISFPSLRDRDRSYGRELGVAAYPETFIVDREGRITALRRGPVTREWLDTELEPVLAESR
jgi:cytochrome c biogenesis protein CcmG, thiol:disulfide interchange protein DsbE